MPRHTPVKSTIRVDRRASKGTRLEIVIRAKFGPRVSIRFVPCPQGRSGITDLLLGVRVFGEGGLFVVPLSSQSFMEIDIAYSRIGRGERWVIIAVAFPLDDGEDEKDQPCGKGEPDRPSGLSSRESEMLTSPTRLTPSWSDTIAVDHSCNCRPDRDADHCRHSCIPWRSRLGKCQQHWTSRPDSDRNHHERHSPEIVTMNAERSDNKLPNE